MRTTLVALTAALALVAGGAAGAPLLNQVDNGTFEEFEDDDPVEWRILDGEANPTSDAYEGDTALVLNAVKTTTESAVAQNVSVERNDLAIVPNAFYDFAFASLLDTGSSNEATAPPVANGTILWKNALGEVTDEDSVTLKGSSTYVTHDVTFQAPPDASEAEVRFSLLREDPTDRTDASLKVDAVAFGPSGP